MCYGTIGQEKSIKVIIGHGMGGTYKRIDFKEGHFETGFGGNLRWEVKNMGEALLIHLGDQNGVLNFYDLFYFLILVLAIFWMVRDLTEGTIFSDKILDGLTVVGYVVLLYPFLDVMNSLIAQWSVKTLTAGRFSRELEYGGIMKFIIMAFLIRLVPLFIKRVRVYKNKMN